MLRYLLDEREFLSPYGIRSMSRIHAEHPYILRIGNQEYRVDSYPVERTKLDQGDLGIADVRSGNGRQVQRPRS